MKFGQLYDGNGHISHHADYVQFNICGLSSIDIVQRYFLYEIHDKPMILLGDYTNKSRDAREDDMLSAKRIFEIKDAISSLKAFGADIWAITLHPVSRDGLHKFGVENITFKQYIDKLNELYQIPVLVKNRHCNSLFLSDPEEIVEYSQTNKVTIDSMLLYESCGYDRDYFLNILSRMNVDNVPEIHVRHMGIGNRDLVGNREFKNHNVKVSEIAKYAKNVKWITFISEGSGRQPQFESMVSRFVEMVRESDRN